MSTWIGTQASLGEMLNSLVELNHDGISAYTAALTRVDREDYRVRMRAMVADLNRQLDALRPHANALTTNVSDSASPKELLTKGRVVFASLMGDEAILGALHKTQQDLTAAYTQAVGFDKNTSDIRALLQAHLQTQTVNTRWFATQLASPPPPQTADEIDATMKTRTIARTDAQHKPLTSSTDI
jgi:hypothetical protein